ncbi:peroxide stress protein YaaA [uncultured Lactobacillus sp.]|uniref:peroxide stress protein YaaA n=1 Tax=uncultured Lactobacillus sp. TaxID=153152 RepID=UPI002622C362|nr:peroxide stress protein YaaA [uncultured Lactobacillus sp.]
MKLKFIIAPAKKMKLDQDSFAVQSQPDFLDKTQILWDFLKEQDFEQLKKIWNANDKIVEQNQKRLKNESLDRNLTPAIVAFDGIQYQYLAADVLEQGALDYLQKNLRIMSALYGLLRPFDGGVAYRLEMQTGMVGFKDYSLYHFWGNKLYQELYKDEKCVINLASKEYSKLISPYVRDDQQFITITFLEKRKDKWRQIATHSKMARGAMMRFAAQKRVKNIDELKQFTDFGFKFSEKDSSEKELVFKKTVNS